MPYALLLANLTASAFMAGLIWFVQIVHYPLMSSVGGGEYCAYQNRHMRQTTWVVGPPMLVEAAAAVLLLFFSPPRVDPLWPWLGVALVAAVWLCTAALQVPCHNSLARGFDSAVHRRLVAGNWARTVLWSARAALACAMLWQSH